MKNFILLFVFCFLIHTGVFSQVPYYYYQVPSGTTNDLYDIKKVSGYVYLITGSNGTLLRVGNSDSSWQIIPTGTTMNINSLERFESSYYPSSPYFGFCNNGILLRGNVSGYNWFTQYCGHPNNLLGGMFIAGSYGTSKYITVGENGIILKRMLFPGSDTNWVQIQSGTTYDLKSVCSKGRFGWIAGINGTILYTADTGNTWNQQFSNVTNNLNTVGFLDSLTGFIAGSGGVILKTANGGMNWVQRASNTTQNLNYIYVNQGIIWVVGNKTVLYSTNEGETFISDTGVPQYNLYGFEYINSYYYGYSIPYFVGEGGRIFRRTLDTIYHPNIYVQLKANNINSYFYRRGIFDNRNGNSSGFEWPKGSGKSAIYTAGLCIGAFVNGSLREAMASYSGEYSPGYCENGNYYTNDYFKIYKISRGDNQNTNWDWAHWGEMVPYGAPYIDVNLNGIYEPAIDTPGVRWAKETLFYCMTDAKASGHSPGEGFGGGTTPLGAEVHLTAWAYDIAGLEDVQFISYDIINKSTSTWNAVKMGIVSDPDLGNANDDYIGCDTTLKLGFCYNGDNDDADYGINPPAVGITLLRSPLNRSVTPNLRIGFTSFAYFTGTSTGPPPCESDPNGESYAAYLMLSGYKKDSTCWLDPTQIPPRKTKYCYPGDPETNTGWTEVKGSIWNCGLDTTGAIHSPNPKGDRRFVLGSGANNFNMIPGESQKFVIAQLIARDSGHLKSVTKLKNLCAYVRNFYESNFPIGVNQISVEVPDRFKLEQNYPNPFNNSSKIKYQITKSSDVKLIVYDLLGREVIILVNEKLNAGEYEVIFNAGALASGVYFYKLVAGDFSEVRRMVLIK